VFKETREISQTGADENVKLYPVDDDLHGGVLPEGHETALTGEGGYLGWLGNKIFLFSLSRGKDKMQ